MLNKIIRFFLENKLVVAILIALIVLTGIVTAPFGWKMGSLPSDPVPVDAIPDIGENQQIVFTTWPGRSPQDIEDQVSYPLTTFLLGIPGVKSIRSGSVFGFSSIYIIFDETVEFYWSRSRVLEKLNSLPPDLLPAEVQPALGPDATALGQIYWYTIEGRDPEGNVTGGWDLHEIRTVQDFYVKYALNAVAGVSEIASIGGYVREYQVDVDPNAMKAHNVGLDQVVDAVRKSNRDVGAKTIEINMAEYLVRGLGYIRTVNDLEEAVVTVNDNVPIRIKDIGVASLGPATRRGALDKGGAEVGGGVVVARFGANPMAVIDNLKRKIDEIAPGLPKKTLADGTVSQLTIVPFYDRSILIEETLGTLEEALSLEILISILVILVMVANLRASILISGLLPISVLMVFIGMRYTGVDANIVALSGIAIAIGTMVDLGIILSENVLKHLDEAPPGKPIIEVIYDGAAEVSGAIITAVSTTIVSFLPVFTMEAAEGKLFRPLAFTKTYALFSALMVTLLILPSVAHMMFGFKGSKGKKGLLINGLVALAGLVIAIWFTTYSGIMLMAFGLASLASQLGQDRFPVLKHLSLVVAILSATWLLTLFWLPLGANSSFFLNLIFVSFMLIVILGLFQLIEYFYRPILAWALSHKVLFLTLPVILLLLGANILLGFPKVFNPLANGFKKLGWDIRQTGTWGALANEFPGIGKEFMPALDEGSFLLMPTSMPHAGVEENLRVVGHLDMLLSAIPEVDMAVGKLGRVESALDPAPISMFENLINYKPEFMVNAKGHPQRFKVDDEDRFVLVSGEVLSNEDALARQVTMEELIPNKSGRYYRHWRSHIESPDDIWEEIVNATRLPGVTSAPRLQPIETRLVMLQTGMRAPMGIKVFGPDLETIENFGLRLESILKEVPSVKAEAVFADRIVGKPYIHLNINREKIARYGVTVEDLQRTIEAAIGGMKITTTVEGRERYPVRVRYPRELRDDPQSLLNILMPTPVGAQVPLGELVEMEYVRGPQIIKSEDTFLVGYVLLDKRQGYAEVDVVNAANAMIRSKIDDGSLVVPSGISYKFSGSYENQIRAEARLMIIVPLVLVTIFLILYFQFTSVTTSLMVFSGIALSFSGGFLMLWLYGQPWFADFDFLGTNMRDLFQMHTVNLSVAVWVGFIALFGIATDDGVLIATYLNQSFERSTPETKQEVRLAVIEAGHRRIRPALMTVATTLIALVPVLTSSGRGSDIMIPMAIPSFGGMSIALISIFVVPTLYCWREEINLKSKTT